MPPGPLPAGSRRALLAGRLRPARSAIRPPWARLDRFGELCTRCDACIQACPEGILLGGEDGLPEVDFSRGECTFCGTCAEVCPAPVFDRANALPWEIAARVGPSCLAAAGVVCQICRDCCPVGAIRFRPVLGRVAQPESTLGPAPAAALVSPPARLPPSGSASPRQGRPSMPPELHISSLLVHARPTALAEVHAAVAALDGVEVHGASHAGQDRRHAGDRRARAASSSDWPRIRELPGVLSAVLVFHQRRAFAVQIEGD